MSGVVWAAGDTISLARANAKSVLATTGTNIALVTAGNGGTAGQLAIATSTTANFTTGGIYIRAAANDGWYPLWDGTNNIVVNPTKVVGTT